MFVGKRTVENQPAVVRKRSKVSKACENCRRRKIKCTGQQPCNNCVTYQCECVYKNGTGSIASSVKPLGTEKLASSISSENGTESNGDEKGGSSDSLRTVETDLQGKNASKVIFDPAVSCVFDNTECIANHIDSSAGCSAVPKVERRNTYGADAVHHPEFSRSDRSELASLETYTPIQGDNGMYLEDTEFQEKIRELQCVLKKLVSMQSPDPHIKNAIAELNEQAEFLLDNWQPKFSFEKFNKALKTGGLDRTKSVETHLMKNKYSDQVFLTTYSVWTDTSKKKNAENPFFGNQALVDDLFGLYSPLQGLSLRGIGFFFQQCTSGSESKEEIIQLKESLYLLLRFFDICLDHVNQSCVSIANPLESYLQRRNLMNCLPMSAPNGVSPSNSNNRDFTSIVIDQLPQPFVEELTNVSSEQLHRLMYDDFAMFDLVLKMYDCHRRGFESLMMEMTRRQKKSSTTPESSLSDRENFIHFCEEEELLLALCYNYYNSTMYHVNEFVANLNYLEALLSLLDIQRWLDEFYGFDKVLGVTMRYAYEIGLARWEHYVGLDEETAERRRKCWWRLYTIEKLYASRKGKQSMIDDAKMNCFLPAEFRSLGFSDNKDFLSKLLTTPRSWAFDNMSIQDLKFYGECAISQVVSHFYSTVLFSERYTSIKNTAKPPIIKEKLVNEVFQRLHVLRSQFDAIKEQTKKLFEVASSSTDGSLNMFLSKDERSLAATYALFHGCFFFAVSTSTNNLIARLLVDTSSVSTIDHYTKYASFLRRSWREMTQLVLSLDDDYTVSRIFDSYGVVCLPLISRAFCDVALARTPEDLIMLLKVFKRVRDIRIFYENKNNEHVSSSKAYHIYIRFFTFLAINIHSMMLGHLRLNKITKDKLFENVRQMSPDVADLPPLILNPKSVVFEALMEPVQTSGFHLKVCSMLERDGKYSTAPKGYPKTASQLMPTSNHETPQVRPFGSVGDIMSPRDGTLRDSMYPSIPSIRSMTDVPKHIGTTHMNEKLCFGDTQQLKSPKSPSHDRQMHASPGTLGFPFKGYNLGTLDEFVNNGDLNDLCNALWSDLYSEEVPQTILLPGDYPDAIEK